MVARSPVRAGCDEVLVFGQRSAASIDRRTNERAASRNDLLTSSVPTSTRRRGGDRLGIVARTTIPVQRTGDMHHESASRSENPEFR
jgi:hypothetical protein